VEIVATLDWSALEPEDGLLVLHPEVELEHDEVSAFLRAGGRLALLDDHGAGDRTLVRFGIHRIQAPLRAVEMLRGDADLAIAIPAVQKVAGHEQGRHPIVAEVNKVVTNHPTALSHPNLTPVLEIVASGEPNATLAVTGIIVKRGRLFAMGDPSTVINLMLRYPGNRAFAAGLVQYLVEDDTWGERGGKLYLVANRFRQRGHFGDESTLGRELREQLDGLSDALGSVHDDGLPEGLAVLLAALITLGSAAWIAAVSTRLYRRSSPRHATETPLVAQGGAAGRAAVLSAPTTHPALALLELKSALEEGFAERLGLPLASAGRALLEEIEQRGLLDRNDRDRFARILSEMNAVEAKVAASQPLRVRQRDVLRAHRDVTDLLDILDRRLGEPS